MEYILATPPGWPRLLISYISLRESGTNVITKARLNKWPPSGGGDTRKNHLPTARVACPREWRLSCISSLCSTILVNFRRKTRRKTEDIFHALLSQPTYLTVTRVKFFSAFPMPRFVFLGNTWIIIGEGVTQYMGGGGRLRSIGVPFLRRRENQRVGVSLVEAYERVGESVISVCKRTTKG